MQLKKRSVRESLARISVGLLSATIPAFAQPAAAQEDYGYDYLQEGRNDNFGLGFSYTELNSALLVYQESGSRVGAIEPTLDLSINGADGRRFQLGLVADTVSGATPNGAVPSTQSQNFLTPIKAQGSTATVTGASGGSTIVHLPPTPGQLAAASLGRQYTAAAGSLPVDQGFRDHRGAVTFGWNQPLGGITGIGFGGGYSRESDYSSITGNTHIDQTFNAGNTTLSLSVNTELDSSFPFGGIPTPLTVMNAQWKTPTSRGKTQAGFVAGLTEVMSRRWLMQVNYAFDQQSGYQNDPYRIISSVDPSSGLPIDSLYENRPKSRQSQSVYWDNRFDLGPAITDLSLRYFADSWGIRSETAELSERLNFGSSFYVEPSVRWYKQTAARFFHYYLVNGTTLPTYATSDTRLGALTATTFAAKFGFILSKRTELYVRAEYYSQTGNGHPADAIGQLKQQNLFAGSKAMVAFLGYKWDFH